MKCRHLIFLLPLIVNINVYAEENIHVVNEYINFELPDYVLNFDELPYPENPEQRNTFRNGKIVYRLTTKNIDELHNERPYMLSDTVRDIISKKGTITEVDILNLFNKENKFVLSNYFPMSLEYTSYNHFYHNEEIIGEYFFGAAADGLLATGAYGYTLNLICNGKIIKLWINFSEGSDLHIPEMLPSIFNKRDDIWYWDSRDSRMHLYELMKDANDNDLPQELIKLQTAWESLLKTISINNSNTQSVNEIRSNVISGTITDDRIRVRTKPLDGEIIGHVNKGQNVTIFARTTQKSAIDGYDTYWYLINYDDVKGWIYGGYVTFDKYDPELLPTLD